MIEKTLRRYLEHALPDPVFLEKLPGAPERRYILEKTGRDVADHIWSAVIAVQSCAPSLLEAAEMSSAAVAAMLAAPSPQRRISGVKLNAEYNFTDTSVKGYRYQAVFDIYYKE